jgi:hypothetical protein
MQIQSSNPIPGDIPKGMQHSLLQSHLHTHVTLVSEVLATYHGALLEIVSFEVINAANLSALSLLAWVGSVLDM